MDIGDEDGEWVFPARAGMNRKSAAQTRGTHGVPRPRGDEPSIDWTTSPPEGCSPPARG